MQKQLEEAKRPCEEKKKECADLERKLKAAESAAQTAQEDYTQKKKEFDDVMQSLLNGIRESAKGRVDWDFSLTQPEGDDGKKWVSVELDGGAVIWFAYPLDKDKKRPTMSEEDAKNNRSVVKGLLALDPKLRPKLRQIVPAFKKAGEKNQEAQSALTTSRTALEKCQREKDALCPKVEELERQLDECRKQAAAQAEAEKKQKETEEANKAAAAEATRLAEQAKPSSQEAERTAQAEKAKADEKAARAAEQEALRKKLCDFCLKYLNRESPAGAPEQQNKLQDLSNTLGKLNDAIENVPAPAQLTPLLEKLATGLQAAQAGADLINQTNDVIKQIKELQAGGNDPANAGKFLKLVGGILDSAAKDPVLKIIAVTLNGIGDLFSAAADFADALSSFQQLHQVNGDLRTKSCAWFLRRVMSGVENKNKANGDLDKAIDNFLDDQYGALISGNDPKLKKKIKQAILAKLRLCCLQKVLKECLR